MCPEMEKTKEELEIEVAFLRHVEEERRQNDSRYAIKLVERVVFGLVALIATSVIIAIISLVINK